MALFDDHGRSLEEQICFVHGQSDEDTMMSQSLSVEVNQVPWHHQDNMIGPMLHSYDEINWQYRHGPLWFIHFQYAGLPSKCNNENTCQNKKKKSERSKT